MITYTNITKSVLDGVERLIEGEFNIRVEGIGTESFSIRPVSDVQIERDAKAEERRFNILITYTIDLGGGWLSVKDKMTARVERLKKLFATNDFYSLRRWDDSAGWQNKAAQDSSLGFNYNWYNGAIEDITYEQEENNLDKWHALINFGCSVTDLI